MVTLKEERQIEQEEDNAKRIQPMEPERNGVQHISNAAGRHSQAEPSPGEVADAFAPGEFEMSSGIGIIEGGLLVLFGLPQVWAGDVAVSS